MAEINYSYTVLSVFLLLFGVFLLFNEPSITGLSTLEVEKDKFLQNEYLDGKFTIKLENSDFINENAVIEVKVLKGGTAIVSRQMSFTEFLLHSGADLEKVDQDGETGYKAKADFIIDLSWFSIIVSESGNFDLNIKFKHDATIYKDKTIPIQVESRSDAGLPEIVDIVFGKLDRDGVLDSNKNEFVKGDKVGCGMVYNGIVNEIKVLLYAPNDNRENPSYSLTNSSSNSQVFSSPQGTAVLISQEITTKKPGQWSCIVELTNNIGTTKGVSSNSLMQLSDSTGPCTEDWECTKWSPCNNGVQVRSCDDNNECGTKKKIPTNQQKCSSSPPATTSPPPPPPSEKPTLPPPPSEKPTLPPPTQKSKSSIWTYLAPVIVLVLLAGIIITTLIIIKRKKAKEIVKEEEIEKPKTEISQTVKKPLTEIESFILKSLESGTDKETLQKQLSSVGWKQDQIKKELNIMLLYKYMKENLSKGLDKNQLKLSLKQKGWPDELLNEVMSKL